MNRQYIIQEIRRCQDPVYFIKNHVYIQSAGVKTLFKLYPFQEECLNSFVNNRYNIVLKSRQLGLSTLMAAYIVWYMLFNEDKVILVISLTEADSKEFVRKVKYAFDFVTPWILEALDAKVVFNNVHTVELSTRSRVKALAPTEDAGRGYSPSLFIVDEAAKIDHMDTIWSESIFPAVNTGGSAIINSTAYGANNFFYHTWTAAVEGNSEFSPIKLDWSVHPDRDEQWYHKTLQHIGKTKFAQEYSGDFLQSGETVIDPDDIGFLKKTIKEPNVKRDVDLGLWEWEEPIKGNKYGIFCDTSRGDGKDYSTSIVIDFNKLQVVAEYKAKVKPDYFADFLMILGSRYNNAMICVENMHTGYAVLRRIVNSRYKNIYHYNKLTEEHYSGFYDDSSDHVLGFTTDSKKRPQAIERLEFYLRNKLLICNSSRLVEELESFIWLNGKPQAKSGANDDLVMSYAIACYLLQHFATGVEAKQVINEKVNQIITANTSINFPYPGYEQKKNGYISQTVNGVPFDASWVLSDRPKKERPPELQTRIFLK